MCAHYSQAAAKYTCRALYNYALWFGYACNRIILKETEKTINAQTKEQKH